MKKKILIVVSSFLIIVLLSSYFIYFRDWRRIVKFDSSVLETVSNTEIANSSNEELYLLILNSLSKKVKNGSIYVYGKSENDEELFIDYADKENKCNVHMDVTSERIDVNFWYYGDDINIIDAFSDNTISRIDSVNIKIGINNNKTNFNFYGIYQMNSINDFESFIKNYYGIVDPFFKIFSQRKSEEGFEYLILPVDRSKDEFGFYGSDSNAHSFIMSDDLIIFVHENISSGCDEYYSDDSVKYVIDLIKSA